MRYLTPVLAAAIILNTATVNADLGDQLQELLADDGVAEDIFGYSVAISGTTSIVGSRGHDDNDTNSGSAYLFDTTTGQQIAKLLASDGASGDQFGISVAISRNTAIVGAYLDDDNDADSGSVYLFDIYTGKQIAKLIPDDGAADDHFGWSVGISGTTAIVGAYRDDDNGTSSGSAYLFDINTGNQIVKLLPNDGMAYDGFGYSVEISGNIAIVGAFGDDDKGDRSGSAYLFDAVTGEQIAKMLPNDGAVEDLFGISVTIYEDIAVVGAWWDDDNGENSGSAYLFDISNPANPTQIVKLLPDDGAARDNFGRSVAISGALGNEVVVVGNHLDDDNGTNTGSAYLFDTTGRQVAKFLPDDGAESDRFGLSVAVSGAYGKEVAIIGAFWHDDNGFNSGSAYLFDASFTIPCPWDLDNSGSVGTSDLLELFAQWGTDGTADFDGSGVVDTSDLLILFANWGPCG